MATIEKKTKTHRRRPMGKRESDWLTQHNRMTVWERFMEAAMRQPEPPDFDAMLRTIGGGTFRQQEESVRIEHAAKRADEALKQWEQRWGEVSKGP